MEKTKTKVETGVEGSTHGLFALQVFGAVVQGKHGLLNLEENVAELVEPEVVESVGEGHEVHAFKVAVGFSDRVVEPGKDELFGQRFVAGQRRRSSGLVVVTELLESELGGVPKLVAELAVALNTEDIEVDIATWKGGKGEIFRPGA